MNLFKQISTFPPVYLRSAQQNLSTACHNLAHFVTFRWRNSHSILLGSIFGTIYFVTSPWLNFSWLPYLYLGLTIVITCILILHIDFPPPSVTFGTFAHSIPLCFPVLIAESMSMTQRAVITVLIFLSCAALVALFCVIFGSIMYIVSGEAQKDS